VGRAAGVIVGEATKPQSHKPGSELIRVGFADSYANDGTSLLILDQGYRLELCFGITRPQDLTAQQRNVSIDDLATHHGQN
jgi:hypothetical protein